jgi:hypothetical protein
VLLTQYCSGYEIEKNEMDRACSANGEEEQRIQSFGGRNLREKDHLEDLGIDGWTTLRWIFRKWDVGLRTGTSWLMIGTGGGQL